MKIITAPEKYERHLSDIFCFLAGGITNCYKWQDEVIEALKQLEKKDSEDYDGCNKLVVFNPRRENFPINDPKAAEEQIAWEYNAIEKCDIFSMYFCGGESDQPICMYEFGRQLLQKSFELEPQHHLAVSVEKGYKRFNDVVIQSKLADPDAALWLETEDVTPKSHAGIVLKA